MDFSAILSQAQKNEHGKQTTACYQTKFTPPKRPTKQTKALSENIKKFLARKEQEDQRKALEERKKRENLLALRDHKAQSRINKHLKVCKAANKSVLADAVDNENTAVTIAGPSQPDEDDYGYVSQEASALYNKIVNKYNNAPPQKPLFSSSGKKTIKDIASTKDRVKQALKQQEVEEALGHRRKRKSTKDTPDQEDRPEREPEKPISQEKEVEKPKIKKKPLPPPIDFTQLLKIAEKKQHEPVVVEVKPKPEEPERLRTKRQMRDYAKEREWRERKEQREKNASEQPNKSNSTIVKQKPTLGKIPKTNGKQSLTTKGSTSATVTTASPANPKKITNVQSDRNVKLKPKVSARDEILEAKKQLEAEKKKLEEMRLQIEAEKKQLALSKSKQEERKKIPEKVPTKVEKQVVKERPIVANGKPKQFPPPDLRPLKPKLSKDLRRPLANKRRIYDDDEEDYDSELDDFIDDGMEEGCEDYSKYISEIFGYDKSKYRNVDDEDDAGMVSSFAQQLKEEHVSTKIGIMEDLEDIRMEALEKKRKALMRKKMKK